MAESIEIRPPTPDEMPAVFHLRYEGLDRPMGVGEQSGPDGFDNNPEVVQIAAFRDGELVGAARMAPSRTEGVCLVQRVVSLYRYQGIGRAIIERLQAEAFERGIRRLELDSSEDAMGFYARLGFLPKYTGRLADSHWMAKDLPIAKP